MSMEKESEVGKSKEYLEQLAIEGIARSRYPDTRIKEIQPGFYADETNYVWIVSLEADKPFGNTITTIDTNDLRAWQKSLKKR